MRRSLLTLAATAVLAVSACSGSAATSAPSVAPATSAPSAAPASSAPSAAPASSAAASAAGGAEDVAIKNFSFSPASVDAKVGDKVSWTNGDDTAHTVTFDDTAVQGSGNLNQGSTFDMTFTKAGAFPYHCKIHPTMKGTVTVS